VVLMARAGRADRRIGRRERCRSSVVEHPLGKVMSLWFFNDLQV
jgi:hypothetical protein